ncbi:hypothetical protein [Plebeiibacterium sediminum]|uniref:DUF4238 domain-containing protein n=1 Tax=Plebeiibacterium sediminum TaxID=2992112 RepID=A0AAE3SIL4_9BACT|nr:hypothetical protein [Plebeiobacterium sediminum]MCW3789363.1 hypothetical protein [Plebeiobacterium sediminum]
MLCKTKYADKTGSHMVPHFLLKRIENIKGKKGRGYELGFTIQESEIKFHFGQSVLPEKLEEVIGEITDKEREENRNPHIVDHIFCSDCEKRLAVVESAYAKTITKTGTEDYESGIISSLGMLFWASIVWRMSINGKSGVILKSDQNEKLRQILDCFLPDKIENLDENGIKENGLMNSMSYKLMRLTELNDEDAKFLLFHPDFYNPLCILIGEFLLCFSLENRYDDLNTKDLFGINKMVNDSSTNTVLGNEVIKPIDRTTSKMFESNVVTRIKKEYHGKAK